MHWRYEKFDLAARSRDEVLGQLKELFHDLLLQAPAGIAPRLARGDARRVPAPTGAFDGVVNLFSSFGFASFFLGAIATIVVRNLLTLSPQTSSLKTRSFRSAISRLVYLMQPSC